MERLKMHIKIPTKKIKSLGRQLSQNTETHSESSTEIRLKKYNEIKPIKFQENCNNENKINLEEENIIKQSSNNEAVEQIKTTKNKLSCFMENENIFEEVKKAVIEEKLVNIEVTIYSDMNITKYITKAVEIKKGEYKIDDNIYLKNEKGVIEVVKLQ